MCGPPFFKSVFGIPLGRSVIIVGVIELIITIVATILNVIKFSRGYDRKECEGLDVCIGPLIKYSVFDALFGVLCSLMLIIGGHTRNQCLLISWLVVTICASFKYIWVVVTHDWTNLEDWISITYLLFYLLCITIVWSFSRELSTSHSGGAILVPTQGVQYPQQGTTIVMTTQTTYAPPPQGYPPQGQVYPPHYQQPPPYNPGY